MHALKKKVDGNIKYVQCIFYLITFSWINLKCEVAVLCRYDYLQNTDQELMGKLFRLEIVNITQPILT